MTDSKFCEHGVNVGLENPPVFCGQCPPDTITKLRADLASVRLDYANECDRARRAEARHERDKDELRADLARVTDERDEAMAALEGVSNALGGLELYELSETAGHVETVVADRDEALAELARVEAERDEARAEVERLNESTMTISWTERATEEACGVSVGLDPLSDVTWTSFYVGVEIRAFFVCLSQWERRVALAEVERLTRERDLQPTITAEDAARCAWNVCGDEPEDGDAAERIDAALRAHAVRAKVPRG